jgi:hypothetical protein
MKTALPALFLALALPMATPTLAQDANAAMKACRGDAMSLCRGVSSGDGRMAACLERQKDKLTPACATELDKANSPCAKELRQRCEAAGHTSQSALSKCMSERAVQVSQACAAKPAAPKASGNA